MNRLHFAVILAVSSFLPEISNALLLPNVNNISILRNISCRLDASGNYGNNFQLCAIRVYYSSPSTGPTNATVYNGLYYANTFRRFIEKGCPKWPRSDAIASDTGIATCNTSYLPYDLSTSVQLCVCAKDRCNENMNSCQSSVEANGTVDQLTSIMPLLDSNLQCSSTTDAPSMCQERPFLDYDRCEAYLQNHSVLCAITVNGTRAIQTAFISETFEAYLDKTIYEARTAAVGITQTNTYVYFNYSNSQTGPIAECACISPALCNQNIAACSLQTVATSATLSHTENLLSTAVYTSPAGPNEESMPQMTTEMESDNTETEMADSASTMITASSTAPVTHTGSSTASTTSIAVTASSSTTTTGVTITGGTSGLGPSATAGIACGIIFSAVVFTAEIVYFKFFYHGSSGGSFERSVAYRA